MTKLILMTILLLPTILFAQEKKEQTTPAIHYVYPESYATQSKSSIGLKVYSGSIGQGVLYGWRHVNYNSEKFFIGGAGYTGQLGGDEEVGTYSYGGLVMGYDKQIWGNFTVDYGFLAGGGGGKFTDLKVDKTTTSGGVVLEPWLGFNWRIGRTTSFNLAASSIHMPNNTDYSGSSVSLRFDFVLQ